MGFVVRFIVICVFFFTIVYINVAKLKEIIEKDKNWNKILVLQIQVANATCL
jgi:hypothetical protein